VKRGARSALVFAALVLFATVPLAAAPSITPSPDLKLAVEGIGSVSAPLQIVMVLTLLSFLPAALVIMTCFTRIVIVFHFLRQALGTGEMPPNQVIIGLTVFLTIFVMAPVADQINERAVQPAIAGKVSVGDAIVLAAPPLRDFMLKQTRQSDLALFVELSKSPRPAQPSDLPMRVVIPAYAISELKTGFQMGFFVFVPFLLIDLVVSTTLLSMGMLQLPPAMISLPFKLLLFVMVDGWNLIVSSLVRSFA
jgi:flagellar biosynthesis protein FliP